MKGKASEGFGQGKERRVVVIGAGLGGLSCAVRLAASGYKVTVLERQRQAGGKLQRVVHGPYRFDRGPSTITMRHAFQEVFTAAGRRLEDYLTLYPIHPVSRSVFADGTTVDWSGDTESVKEQIARYSPEDARALEGFMTESRRLFDLSRRYFLNRLMLDWRDMGDLRMLRAFLQVRPMTTLKGLLTKYFRHPHTLAMLGRYATYVGASPEQAPAIFAMLAHAEAELGVYGVQGGTYEIVQAFVRLALELGVKLVTGAEAERILTRSGRVCGVRVNGCDLPADLVVANADLLTAYSTLLPPEARPRMPDARITGYEPSLSGFALLAALPRRPEMLRHHTVFFPEHYETEFHDIFGTRQAPQDPALYVCNPAYSEPEGSCAPAGGSSLFILANAPYLSPAWSWETERERYQEKVLERLSARGLGPWLREGELVAAYTPADLYNDTRAYRGAIYGISSNGRRQTFFRPGNRCPDVSGLWFVGGTTHPGGGTPIVVTSGRLVAERILEEA